MAPLRRLSKRGSIRLHFKRRRAVLRFTVFWRTRGVASLEAKPERFGAWMGLRFLSLKGLGMY